MARAALCISGAAPGAPLSGAYCNKPRSKSHRTVIKGEYAVFLRTLQLNMSQIQNTQFKFSMISKNKKRYDRKNNTN